MQALRGYVWWISLLREQGGSEMVTTARFEIGSIVMSGDGKKLGTVKEVVGDRFKVERRLLPDLWLATEYVDHTSSSEGLVQMVLPKQGIGAARVTAPR
jgi:hypothetical protein